MQVRNENPGLLRHGSMSVVRTEPDNVTPP
jgi:hypothetical protein